MKKIIFGIFIIVCIVQLAVPAKMIWDKEKVISMGHEYKFRTAPVDPYDPFRGKYITLSFNAQQFTQENSDSLWQRDDDVYALLGLDSAGFAIVENILKNPPEGKNISVDYIKAKIRNAYGNQVRIDFPFTRFYMEESKAKSAEEKYWEANARNSPKEAYALVYVKEGEATLKDVLIDGVSIREIARQK